MTNVRIQILAVVCTPALSTNSLTLEFSHCARYMNMRNFVWHKTNWQVDKPKVPKLYVPLSTCQSVLKQAQVFMSSRHNGRILWNCVFHYKIVQPCLTWLASLSQWFVFRMLHVCLVDKLVPLWMGLLYAAIRIWQVRKHKSMHNFGMEPGHLIHSRMCYPWITASPPGYRLCVLAVLKIFGAKLIDKWMLIRLHIIH